MGGERKEGVGGAFILGALFSVVTFTCTIPIAASILSIAAGQYRLAARVAMFFYSATMAVPFFLMGLFPRLVHRIPRSGEWPAKMKTMMGIVELGLAMFYFSKADLTLGLGILTRPVMPALWVLITMVVGFYFLKKRPVLAALLILAFGGWMAYGFTGKPLGIFEILVPPAAAEGTTMEAALREARAAGQPLFVEFTGVTWTNCLANRGTVLVAPGVKDLLKKYFAAELWTDLQNPKDEANNKLLTENYGGVLPLHLIFTADGREVARIGRRPSVSEFAEFLKKGIP